MKSKHFDVIAASGEIASALSAMGCLYELEADNRGGKRASRYLCVRKPIAAKVRVANHRSNWVEQNAGRSRILMLDVGPHALSVADAIAQLQRQAISSALTGKPE